MPFPGSSNNAETVSSLFPTEDIREHFAEDTPLFENPAVMKHSRYIKDNTGYPAYSKTSTLYYPLGEFMWKDMLNDLKSAEKFIFIEYFIIEPGRMWDSILAILLEKRKAGVEVRILYDDLGCMYTLPHGYFKSLEKYGIRSKVCSPLRPRLEPAINRRDHRKLCIIDGIYGYTGGINLADEYINARPKHGHWKDTAIRLCGEECAVLP